MGENFLSVFCLFLLPFAAGFVVRMLCRKVNRAYLITVALAVLAVIAFIVVFAVFPGVGSFVDLVATILLCAACGSFAAGVLLLVSPG